MTPISPAARARREEARDRQSGEFGVQQHSAPEGATVHPLVQPVDADQVRADLAHRVEELRAHGYAPAAVVDDPFDPARTSRRDEWWQASFALAEHARGGGYHVMPDDYTPGMTEGQSLTGHRRTHRMKYEGGGAVLRMPSATAIKRYADDIDGATFDVPVEAHTPAGTMHGYVRVTRGKNGLWLVESPELGRDEQGRPTVTDPATGQARLATPREIARSQYVTEAVNAVLESRRPSLALKEVGDLMARRRERRAQLGETLVTPDQSGVVKGVAYSAATQATLVRLGNRVYAYADTSPQDASRLLRNYSPGRVYNQHFKNRKPSIRVEQCPDCRRYALTTIEHRCPFGRGRAKRTMKFERLLIQQALGMRKHRSLERARERAEQERSRWLFSGLQPE